MSEILNARRLPDDVQKIYAPYLAKMISLHQGNIACAFIYGSATGANYRRGISDINSGYILCQMRFDSLKKSLSCVAEGLKKKISAPLFLTEEYISSSKDVFPIEFLDIKENHVLLYGRNILDSLDISDEYVRLFCEQQVKGKILRILQGYLEQGSRHQKVEALMKESFHSLLPVFRSILRLQKSAPPVEKPQIIQELCARCQLEKDVFLTIHNHLPGKIRWKAQEVEIYFKKYLDQLVALAGYLDRWR